jgi:outer membrane protein OmpA-like peptidoglycan-associated protein
MVKRTKGWLGAVGFAVALLETPAEAQVQTQRGFAVDKFEPAVRGSSWFENESLDLRGHLRPAFGITSDYAYRPFIIFEKDGDVQNSVVRNQFYIRPGGSIVLFDRLRLEANLPIQAAVDGHTGVIQRNGVTTFFNDPPKSSGLGDLRFGADARLYGVYGDPITMALGLQAWAPTGKRSQWAGDGAFRVRPRLMAAGEMGIFNYSASGWFGYRARQEVVGIGKIGNELGVSVGVGLQLLDKKLTFGPEAYLSSVLTDFFGRKSTPIEGLLGVHYLIADQFRVGAFGGLGLGARSYGEAIGRYGISLDWMPGVTTDRDGDGIPDSEDACPDVKGLHSADPAKNGCPAEAAPVVADRDHDGIPDGSDACPDEPGVATNDPATNGCKDTDGDGIADKIDACPTERGAPNSDPQLNGCPDTDGDGIVDKKDACPREAGPPNADPAKNGCPDKDRDKDGIANDVDACPDEPGPADPDPKKNGCPKAFISQGQIKILDQVKFKTGSAAIEQGRDSLDILEAVAKVLKDHPEVKKVRVEGHTDKTGAAAMNKKLSADRAASVVKWLTSNGIDKSRLSSQGFGSERPIDTNDTEQGKKNNRRVEFHIE